MLSEQLVHAHTLRVKHLHQRLRILRQTRSEHNKFIVLMHPLEELRHERPDQDVDHADLVLNLNRQGNVRVLHCLERGVDQGLV